MRCERPHVLTLVACESLEGEWCESGEFLQFADAELSMGGAFTTMAAVRGRFGGM